MTKSIPLFNRDQKTGDYALVDDEDYAGLSSFRWGALKTKWGVYAKRNTYINKKVGAVLMHRQILKPQEGMLVDHINGNKLDNRRSNLRVVTPAENNLNRQCLRVDNTSGFIGVNRTRRGNRWVAKIQYERAAMYLGTFDCPIEAAIVRDIAALDIQGDMATLNFPQLRAA